MSAFAGLDRRKPPTEANPLIVSGTATYGLDVRVPGMLYAALRQSPVHGGKLKRFYFDAIKNMPGVRGVAVVDPSELRKPSADSNAVQSAIAVVAEHYWQARRALEALPVEWHDGEGARWKTTQHIYNAAIAELEQPGTQIHKQQGDAMKRIASHTRRVEATYLTPYCDHMLMEPLNGTALVTKDRVDLWHPTPHSEQAFLTAAEEAGVPLHKVHFHQPLVGGSFGRRTSCDDVRMVIAIAKRFPNHPVQVIWSREETMRQGRYRPLEAVKLLAALNGSSMPDALLIRLAGRGLSLNGFTDAVYLNAIPHHQIESRELPLHILTGPYRAPGNNSNVFMLESFVDELAHAAKMDPLHYRMMLLDKWPDLGWRHCLREVATQSGWSTPLPRNQGRGVAIANWGGWGQPQQGTTVAVAATVEVTPGGELRILRVDIAFDCGRMLNEDAALAQLEGAAIYGMNMTLNEELTVEDGRIVEGNVDQYPMLRLVDVPKQLHIHLGGLSHHLRYGEIGEAGVGPIGPAIGNAIFAASGVRLRQTPFRKLDLRTS